MFKHPYLIKTCNDRFMSYQCHLWTRPIARRQPHQSIRYIDFFNRYLYTSTKRILTERSISECSHPDFFFQKTYGFETDNNKKVEWERLRWQQKEKVLSGNRYIVLIATVCLFDWKRDTSSLLRDWFRFNLWNSLDYRHCGIFEL